MGTFEVVSTPAKKSKTARPGRLHRQPISQPERIANSHAHAHNSAVSAPVKLVSGKIAKVLYNQS